MAKITLAHGAMAPTGRSEQPMNCTVCTKPIVLVPSANERVKRYGGKPSDYTRLFRTHANCALKARQSSLEELLRRTHGRPD